VQYRFADTVRDLVAQIEDWMIGIDRITTDELVIAGRSSTAC
jgi:hypothetical protein